MTKRLIIKKKSVVSGILALIMCFFATTSALLYYIVPSRFLRSSLIIICFGLELYYTMRSMTRKDVRLQYLYLLLLIVFPVISFQTWGIMDTIYYVSSLLTVIVIIYQRWELKITFKVMFLMYFMYALCTIIFFFTPDLYKTKIVYLFPDNISRLLKWYNSGCMAGLTAHYSINGMFISLGFLMVCANVIMPSGKRKNLFKWAEIAFFGVALLLTGKRAHILFSFFAFYIVYGIVTVNRDKKVLNAYFKVIGVVLVLLIIAYTVIASVPALSVVFERIQESIAKGDIDNGRYLIWNQAVNVFKKHPIFGIGWKNFSTSFGYGILNADQAYDVHNVFLQLLCETGVVGFCVYCIWFIKIFFEGVRQLRKAVTFEKHAHQNYYIIFAVEYQVFFLVYCLTGNPLYEKITYFPYFVSCGIILFFERHSNIDVKKGLGK